MRTYSSVNSPVWLPFFRKAFAKRKPGDKVRESSVGYKGQVELAIQSWRDPMRWPADRPQPKIIVSTVKNFYELLAKRKLSCKRVHTLIFDEADQTVTPVDLDKTPLHVQEARFQLFKKKIRPDARVLMVSATFTPKFIDSILTRTLLSRPGTSIKQISRAIATFQKAHPGVTPAHWSEHKADFEKLQSASMIDFDQELNTQRTIDLFYCQCATIEAKMKFCIRLRQLMVAESTERGAESVPRTLIFANTHTHCEKLMQMFNMQNAREGGDGNVARMLTGSSKWRRGMEKSIGVEAARKLSYRDYENHIQESIAALKAEGDPCQVLIATDVLNRGVDIDGLALVINLSPPLKGWERKPIQLEGDLAIFEHRAGRCGRFGDPGVCVTLETCPGEQNRIESLGDLRNPANLPFRKMITRKNEGQDALFQIIQVRSFEDLKKTTDDTMTRAVFQVHNKNVEMLVKLVVRVHSKLTEVLVEKERKNIVAAIKEKKLKALQSAATAAPASGGASAGGAWVPTHGCRCGAVGSAGLHNHCLLSETPARAKMVLNSKLH